MAIPPLVLVYLGDFPAYGARAVELAAATSGVPVVLLTDGEVPSAVRRWHIDVREFYDDGAYRMAEKVIDQDPTFRDGFWFRSLERLFVLQQYRSTSSTEVLFHAELDNLVFRLDRFHDVVGRFLPAGTMTLPWSSPDFALASLVYVCGAEALDEFVQFGPTSGRQRSEMRLLAAFGRAHPDRVVQAPSLECLVPGAPKPPPPAVVDDAGASVPSWMFDAAAMGQWIAGEDAANSRSAFVCNHFVNATIAAGGLRPRARIGTDGELQVDVGEHRLIGHNIHLHHKIQRRIRSLRDIDALLAVARLPMPMPLAVNWQMGPRAARSVVRRARRIGVR